jgi:hypothetical protein
MIGVQVETVKELPVKELAQYCDDVVFNVARATLDFTNTGEHFPYLTGELNRASMAEGVVKESYATYHVGAEGVNYAPAVWGYPQNTNWTNKNTYAQWYVTQFKEKKELIIDKAVSMAKKKYGLK